MERPTRKTGILAKVRDDGAIIEKYLEGYKGYEIAEMFHIDDSVVSTTIRKYKNRGDKSELSFVEIRRMAQDVDTGKVKALYNARWSVKDIADDMGVPEQVIQFVIELMKEEGNII